MQFEHIGSRTRIVMETAADRNLVVKSLPLLSLHGALLNQGSVLPAEITVDNEKLALRAHKLLGLSPLLSSNPLWILHRKLRGIGETEVEQCRSFAHFILDELKVI